MSKHYFGRKAVVSLLKLAQHTSDPKISAALVGKAADLKDHLTGELTSDIVKQSDPMFCGGDNLRLFVWITWGAALLLLPLAGTLIFMIIKH